MPHGQADRWAIRAAQCLCCYLWPDDKLPIGMNEGPLIAAMVYYHGPSPLQKPGIPHKRRQGCLSGFGFGFLLGVVLIQHHYISR